MNDPIFSPRTEVVAEADFDTLVRCPSGADTALTATSPSAMPTVARFDGFDLLEQPLVSGVAALPGERLVARSIVRLHRAQMGSSVVLLFENGDCRLPLIVGVLEQPPWCGERAPANPPSEAGGIPLQVDGECYVIEAEREIVLRCGEASITLTRAGKVVIQGTYVLSRSRGYNKIKGAAIELN